MPIDFIQQKKKQKYLIMVFAAIIIITGIVLWYGFFREDEPVSPITRVIEQKEIRINFDILEKPILKELQPFQEVFPFEGILGRDNPFLPY